MGYALDQLGPQRCAEIAEGLFTVQKVYGQKLNGLCPVHGDKNMSFFYNPELDACACSACGFKGDLVKLWCEITGREFIDFKKEFVGDAPPAPSAKPRSKKPAAKTESAPADIFVPESDLDALPPLSDEYARQMIERRRWSMETIRALDLREHIDFKGDKRIAIPVRDDDGGLRNVRLYLPGAPEFKVISWSDPVCRQCGGAFKYQKKAKKRLCVDCGSEPTSYGTTRLFPTPAAWKRGAELWLVEGEPDLICALSHGLNAVTQTAGANTWPDRFSALMKGFDVVIGYDADKPGFEGAQKAAQSIVMHAKSVRIVMWPEDLAA
jgi:putative DNA primase/helicase